MIELLDGKKILDETNEIREYYTENGIVRAFWSKDCIQSLTYIDEQDKNKLTMEYFEFFDLPIELNPNGKNYLVLGGGMLSYPKYYITKYKDKKMDVVEINKNNIEYAKKYFFLGDDILNCERLNIIIDDAKKYIYYCQKKYDYILVDLFNGKVPVSEIYNEEVLKKIRNMLNINGVIIINYIISDYNIKTYKNHLNEIKKIADNYKIITNKNNFNTDYNVGNIIIIISSVYINIQKGYNYIDLTNII